MRVRLPVRCRYRIEGDPGPDAGTVADLRQDDAILWIDRASASRSGYFTMGSLLKPIVDLRKQKFQM